MVCDYRKLNAILVPRAMPISSNLAQQFNEVGANSIFSNIDCRKAFNQILLTKESVPLTAITTSFGLYEYLRLPFGLRDASGEWCDVMRTVYSHIKNLKLWVDDTLLASKSEEEHADDVIRIIDASVKWRILLASDKCRFGDRCGEYAGHIVTQQSLRPLPKVVRRLTRFGQEPPSSWTVTKVRQFMGCVNWLGHYIPIDAAQRTRLQKLVLVDDNNTSSVIPECESLHAHALVYKQASVNSAPKILVVRIGGKWQFPSATMPQDAKHHSNCEEHLITLLVNHYRIPAASISPGTLPVMPFTWVNGKPLMCRKGTPKKDAQFHVPVALRMAERKLPPAPPDQPGVDDEKKPTDWMWVDLASGSINEPEPSFDGIRTLPGDLFRGKVDFAKNSYLDTAPYVAIWLSVIRDGANTRKKTKRKKASNAESEQKVTWTEDTHNALNSICTYLTGPAGVQHFDADKDIHMFCDSSQFGRAAAIFQAVTDGSGVVDNTVLAPVQFTCQQAKATEMTKAAGDIEMDGWLSMFRALRPFILACRAKKYCYGDHNNLTTSIHNTPTNDKAYRQISELIHYFPMEMIQTKGKDMGFIDWLSRIVTAEWNDRDASYFLSEAFTGLEKAERRKTVASSLKTLLLPTSADTLSSRRLRERFIERVASGEFQTREGDTKQQLGVAYDNI